MPFDQVMKKFQKGSLTSGSKGGPKVTNRKQAIAILLSEKEKAAQGKTEYQSKGQDPDGDQDSKPLKGLKKAKS